MPWSIVWLIVRVVFQLLPEIIRITKEEKAKQKGRDEVVEAVLGRFKDVSKRAEDARTDTSDRLDRDGVRSDETFRRP